jgi:YidC/Oxa1 family membrane protein insertase
MWDTIIITPFLNALLIIYNLVFSNFGIAIILFTLLVRLLTHPLTVQQIKGTQAMQNLQTDKRYIEMQKKYKDDKEKLAQEQMALYKEMGINPFASCLPMLIQFPIWIGLYQTIRAAMADNPLQLLYLEQHIYPQFLNAGTLIPLNSQFLWMNLGQPERLILPFLPFGIPVLAIIVVITSYLQSKLMTPPTTGTGNDQSAQMGKMMNLYMPLMMGYLAWSYVSGLAVYFVASNVFTIAQYSLLGKVNWRNILPGNLFPSPNKSPGTKSQTKTSASSERSLPSTTRKPAKKSQAR